MNLLNLKINAWLCVGVCLLAGLVIGYLDQRASEVQGIVLLLLAATGLPGFIHPAGAWRWALLIGCGVPATHLVRRALGYPPSYPVEPNVFASFLALIPAFIGAYAGALLRRAAEAF
ncbi:MAG TPA: hypothetical protein VNQ79_23375 [Blastocatellia bacterium]|nr:hypothetical protein [Blastocatellia bacterium]